MAKTVHFFDGAQSSTTPTIGNVDTTNLAQYANDAAYEAANAGAPSEGNIYANTTDNVIRYYNGTAWTTLADDASVQTFQNKIIDGTDATGNNTVLNDATDVSYDNTTSGLVATTAQAAIDEVESRLDTAESDISNNATASSDNTTDIADIRTMTGTADGATDMGTFTGSTLSDNTDLRTLLQEIEDAVEAVGGALVFAGTWDANANSPALSDGVGTQGEFYIVSTSGTTSLDGISDWSTNDWAIFDGTVWRKIDNSELVTSVNGQTGNATIGVNDLDGLVGTNGARREIRRDSGNTAWEIYNPHNNATDAASGANATLGGVGAKVVFLSNGALESVGGVGAGYSNQTFILINKTGVPVTINNEDAVATAADRVLTGTSGPIDLDVDAAIPLVYDGASSRWRLAAGTGGGTGGLSGIITGNNSTADSTLGDWATYADAAQDTPVDGTGGTANITLTRTTSSLEILQGKASFEIVKGAFDRQGEGVSLDIPVDKYLRGQPAKLAFSYGATADFDFGSPADPIANPSDIQVFLYDVTNSKIINVNQPYIYGGGLYQAAVQIPSNCETVRVILHIATTNALAWGFRFDRVQLELAPNEFFTRANTSKIHYLTADVAANNVAMTDLDFTGLKVGKYYRLTLQVWARNLDNQDCTTEVEAIHDGNIILIEGNRSQNTAAGAPFDDWTRSGSSLVFKATDTSITFLSNTGGTGYVIEGNNSNSSTWAQLEELNNYEDVEVAAASGLNAQVVMRAYKNGGSVTANTTIASWTAKEKDSVNGFDATTGVYTVKSPGDYFVSVIMQNTVQTSDAVRIMLNGTQYALGVGDGNSSIDMTTTVITDLKYGDEISIQHTGSVTLVSSNNSALTIYKLGSQQQPYAPRVAYIKDVKASGVVGGAFTSGAWQTRVLNTISGDQSFISLAANQFTLQPGTYHINATAPGYKVDDHKIKLRNITDSVDTLIGDNTVASSTDFGNTRSHIKDTFTITSTKVFEIQHRCLTTAASNGFGNAPNLGVDEVYTQVKITKVL